MGFGSAGGVDDMEDWRTRLRPLGVAVWHLVLALLLAYVFILVLMTASSQAGVTERLAKHSPPLDYSAAYPLWLERQGIDREIATTGQALDSLAGQIEVAARAERKASNKSWLTLAPLHALHPVFSQVPYCMLDPINTATAEVAKTLSKLAYCVPDANVTPRQRAQAMEVVGDRANIVANSQAWLDQAESLAALRAQREDRLKHLQALELKRSQLKGVSDSFGEVAVLQRSWLPGGAALIEFPPSMTQILLAFVSGMFGSLLLTLVLIVYPKTDMTLGATDKGYGPRILLGGLISLCVFVVIGGGTAVLGANDALSEGKANFLAFCAIGILAGMFADRVAAWLSERADTFFKLTKQQAAAKAEGAAERAVADAEAAAEHRAPKERGERAGRERRSKGAAATA